jgi:hypothetical protein
MGRPCSTNGEKRNAYRVLVGKPERKKPLERPRRRWVDNIKMGLREGWYELDRWKALVNTVTNFRIPYNVLNSGAVVLLAASQERLVSLRLVSVHRVFPHVTSCLRHIHHMTKRRISHASVRARQFALLNGKTSLQRKSLRVCQRRQ